MAQDSGRAPAVEAADVVVLGGGFAGIAAARGIMQAGRSAIVLEARDRIGGRAWTSAFDGFKIEYGATWIHWFQPYVWAEFMRSGLALHEDPWLPPITIFVDGAPQPLEFQDFREILSKTWRAFADTAPEGHRVDRPYQLGELADADALDALSVQDAIDGLNLSPVEHAAFSAEIAVQMNALPRDVSYLSQIRWWSAAGWDVALMIDCLARYKVETGLGSLIEVMAERARLDIRLNTPIASVRQDDEGVTVTARDGRVFSARKVICALPMNCIADLDVDPPLGTEKIALSKERHAAKGIKVLFTTSGEEDGHAVVAPPGAPLNFLNPIRIEGDRRLYVGFGTDGQAFDPKNLDEVNSVLADLHPGLKADATTGHDWANDEFSRGTWHMPRPTQNMRTARAFAAPEKHIHFAGDYLARGWTGFVDGAIESGILTGDEVHLALADGNA